MHKTLTTWTRALPLVLALTLTGCQSLPTPSTTFSPQQLQVLRTYGFEATSEGWELQMPGTLLFEFNSDKLTDSQRRKIEEMAHALLACGISRLRLEGHTDDLGSDAYNKELSLRRAQAVAQAIIQTGIPARNIELHGYGDSRPLVSKETQAIRKENRRVAVIVPVQ